MEEIGPEVAGINAVLSIHRAGNIRRSILRCCEHRALAAILTTSWASFSSGCVIFCAAAVDLVKLLRARVDTRFARDRESAYHLPDCPRSQGELRQSHRVRQGPTWPRSALCDLLPTGLPKDLAIGLDTLADGIRRTLDWYLGNETWWLHVQCGAYQDWIKLNYGARI